MTHHVRAAALSLAWTIVGCHRGGGEPVLEPVVGPGPIAEVEVDNGALPIIPIPQLTPVDAGSWLFEPESRRFATTEFGDCSIFDVESGRLILGMPVDDTGPCVEWQPSGALFNSASSSDERLALDTSNNQIAIVDADSGKQLRVLKCPDCATHDDFTWSRTGHRLALVWMEPPRIEVWDADTGERQWAEQIPIAGELEELALGWSAGGATVLWTELGFAVECEAYEYGCYYDDAEQRLKMRPTSRQAMVLGESKAVIPLGDRPGVQDVLFDPEARWAFWQKEWSEERSGTVVELQFEGLVGQGPGLGYRIREDVYEGGTTRSGTWRNDGLIHWAATITYDDLDGNPVQAWWETTIVSPPIGRREGLLVDDMEWGTQFEADAMGFAGDALRVIGEVCREGNCSPIGVVVPPNCVLYDVASGHGTELFDCDGQLFMRNNGGMKRLSQDPSSVEWWWSRGGALALYDVPTLTVLDAASGVGGFQRTDLYTVLDGRLGLEIDRLMFTSDAGLEIVDLVAGKVVAKLPDVFPEDAAFSPTGDRLAVLFQGEVRVFSLPGAEVLTSWSVEGTHLAFRQDGKAIFVGDDMPFQSFDAATGKPLDPTLLELVFPAYQAGVIDPSWRWIMNDETGELVRLLDGLTLMRLDDGAWVPETGHYQGKGLELELAYRVGHDVWAVPEFRAKDLAKWLERDDLTELFLSGQPIPKPTMTAGELAGVRAALEGQK